MDADDPRAAERTEIVATVSGATEAELIAGLLENHGIAARISADDGGAQFPSLDPLRGVRVIVLASDVALARSILGAVEPLAEGEAPPES